MMRTTQPSLIPRRFESASATKKEEKNKQQSSCPPSKETIIYKKSWFIQRTGEIATLYRALSTGNIKLSYHIFSDLIGVEFWWSRPWNNSYDNWQLKPFYLQKIGVVISTKEPNLSIFDQFDESSLEMFLMNWLLCQQENERNKNINIMIEYHPSVSMSKKFFSHTNAKRRFRLW